ncbi:MAG: thioesterase family protein [Cyanobacteria bacterium J06641_5]
MSIFRFSYCICLADTDAAGVVYFSRLLEICHRAYEAALAAAGIELAAFLAPAATIALPISQVEARFLAPLRCGDRLTVEVSAALLEAGRFAVDYCLLVATYERPAAIARTTHTCIDLHQRQRQTLPVNLRKWVVSCARDRS